MPNPDYSESALRTSYLRVIGFVNAIAYQKIQANVGLTSLFPVKYAQDCLNIQAEEFVEKGFDDYSLSAQLTRFIRQMSINPPRGIVFVNYDGTILRNSYNSSRAQWIAAFASLRKKGYAIVLLTNRVPVIGEADWMFRRIINGDLKDFFTAKIFVSRVMLKGLLMYYLADKLKLQIPFVLVDDKKVQRDDASSYGFITISFERLCVALSSRVAGGVLDYFHLSFAANLARTAGTTQLPLAENDPWIFEQLEALPDVNPPPGSPVAMPAVAAAASGGLATSPFMRLRAPSPIHAAAAGGSLATSPHAYARAPSPTRGSPVVVIPREIPHLQSPVCTPTYSEIPMPSHPVPHALPPPVAPAPVRPGQGAAVAAPSTLFIQTVVKKFFS